MKLKYRILYKFKWQKRLRFWYLMTFHKERTLRNFRAFLIDIMNDKTLDED
jgi:hypothetical protein